MTEVLLGQTDYSKFVFIPDPASTDGSGKTGLVAANLTVSYSRMETDNDATVTDATSSLNDLAALTTAHTDWGVKEVSSTLAPGLYRLDFGDAVFAAGAWTAVVYVMITTSAAAASPIEFELVAVNKLDAVRGGMTALPNAAADAAGGLIVSDAGGLDADAQRSDVGAIKTKTDFLPSVTAGASGGVFIAGTNAATTVTTAFTTTFTGNLTGSVASVSGAVGSVTGLTAADVGAIKTKTDFLPSATAGAAGGVFIAGTNAATTVTTAFTTTFTGNLTGSVGSVTGLTASNLDATVSSRASQSSVDDLPTNAELATALGTADDAVLAQVALVKAVTDKLDDTVEDDAGTYRFTADALEQAPTGGSAPTAAEIADEVETRTIAAVTLVNGLASDSVTASALAADAVTEIQSGLATASALSTLSGKVDTIDDFLDTEVAAILSDTNELQTDWADGGRLDLILDARASQTSVDTIDDFVDTEVVAILAAVDTEVAAIKTKTDFLPSATAGAAGGLFIAGTNAATTITTSLTTTFTGSLTGSVASVSGNVGGNVTGSVGSVTGLTASNLDATVSSRLATAGYTAPLSAAGTRTAVGLASANLDTQLDALPTNAELATALGTADDAVLAAIGALPTADENADALLDRADAVETGLTPRQAMRLSAAADGGKLSGGATTTNTIRNAVADDKDRIIATVDSDGNRTAITYDLT